MMSKMFPQINLLLFLIFCLLPTQSKAQDWKSRLLAICPDKPVHDAKDIFVIRLPEWENAFDYREMGVNLKFIGNDPLHNGLLPFGQGGYGNPGSSFRLYDGGRNRFYGGKKGRNPLLDGYEAGSSPDVFIKLDQNPGQKPGFIIYKRTGAGENATIQELTDRNLLGQIDRGNYKIERAGCYITQDREHVLVDVYLHFEALEGPVKEHHWITIKLEDFSIKYDVKLPTEGYYLNIIPYGVDDRFRLGSEGYQNTYDFLTPRLREASFNAPGTDVVLARYWAGHFMRNTAAVVQVEMKTGKLSFLPPPRDELSLPISTFISSSMYPQEAGKLPKKMWRTTPDGKTSDYEVILSYREADSTLITVSARYFKKGVQLVMQNVEGEYVDRLPQLPVASLHLPFLYYRVRNLYTRKIKGEFSLLSAAPMKISHDGKYMVCLEGTRRYRVITLRERLTGKLIQSCPGIDLRYTKNPMIKETSVGFVVGSNDPDKFHITTLRFPGRDTQKGELPMREAPPTAQLKSLPASKAKYTYDSKGMLNAGQKVSDQFYYLLAREGRLHAFNKDGKAAPQSMNMGNNVESYLRNVYSPMPGKLNSIRLGALRVSASTKQAYLTDWFGNELSQQNAAYKPVWYLDNGLIWLNAVKKPSQNFVWDIATQKMTEISISAPLKSIFHTRNKKILFPLTRSGVLYKVAEGESSKLTSGIDWLWVFTAAGKDYLLVFSSNGGKAGILDKDGNVLVKPEYQAIQVSDNSPRPLIYLIKRGVMQAFDLEKRTSKELIKGVEVNQGFKQAFGKYGLYKSGKEFVCIDEQGVEKLRFEASDAYGTRDFIMARKSESERYYLNEKGENPFRMIFSRTFNFNAGLALVWLPDGRNGYIDMKGEFVIGPFPMK